MIKLKTTRLTSQGQITLGKQVIEEIGLISGSILEVWIDKESNKIILQKPENTTKKYQGILKGKSDLTTEKYLRIRKGSWNDLVDN